MEAETNDNLAKNGLVADLTYKTRKIKARELADRDAIEQKRLQFCARLRSNRSSRPSRRPSTR